MVSKKSNYPANDPNDPIGRFISERSRMAPPTKEECDRLFTEMHNGSDEARKELIERHIRLVASIALKFRQTNVNMEDIMAEGIRAILALDKFDQLGIKLSTYAAWWIRQRIQRLIEMSGAVAIPYDVSQVKKRKPCPVLTNRFRRNPTDDEVKQALGRIVTSPIELNLPLPAHFH